jgi:hypothetical protein
MHFIHENLAVCGFCSLGDRRTFAEHGFAAQLQCAEHFPPWLGECVEVMSLPFADDGAIPRDLFRKAQDWLDQHWDAGSRILVSCVAGQSRSVTMAVAMLARRSGRPFVEVAREVVAAVPSAYPHPRLLVSAARHCGQPIDLAELRTIFESVRVQHRYPWPDTLLEEAAADA